MDGKFDNNRYNAIVNQMGMTAVSTLRRCVTTPLNADRGVAVLILYAERGNRRTGGISLSTARGA